MMDLRTGIIVDIKVKGVLIAPVGLALDVADRVLYVSDYGNHVVLKVDLAANATSSVVVGMPGVVGGPGDAGTKFRGTEGPATEARLRHPGGLALDPLAKRLFVADTANPAIRVVDLPSGRMTRIAERPGYYGHELSEDDVGPVGLALTESYVPGIEVLWTIHANIELLPWTTEGEYFHFDGRSVPGLIPVGTTGNPYPVTLPPSILRMVRQYRRGVIVWLGQVRCWGKRTRLVGPQAGFPCPACTATCVKEPPGVCIPAPCDDAEFKWDKGDVVQFLGTAPGFAPKTELHKEPAVQTLFMAEGHNFVVRSVNVASVTDQICHPVLNQTWQYLKGILF